VNHSGHVLKITHKRASAEETFTSCDNPAVSPENIVNDVLLVYIDLGQLNTDHQSHEDAVNLATPPQGQYTYADGANNTARPTAQVYPNGREFRRSGSTGHQFVIGLTSTKFRPVEPALLH
jgi:hypothetical protein